MPRAEYSLVAFGLLADNAFSEESRAIGLRSPYRPAFRSYLCVRIFSAIRRSEIAFKHGALKAVPLVSNSVFKVICLELFGHLTQHHEQSRRNTCYEHCGRRGAATSREPAQICASSRELSGVRAGCPDGKDGLDARDHSAQDSRRRPQS